jgi:hypothetical protein
MITVEVTSTNYIVNATEASYNVTVSADNSLFTITNVTPSFTVTNITPTFNFTAEGSGFEFANKFLGDWVSGDRYYRNDVVQYQYSTYICNVEPDSYVESSTPPPNDTSSWILFIFNEWPRAYLTITNTLSVGSTATFNILNVGSTSSTGTFAINGLEYPKNKGTYGQVLYTNGETNAAWVNLGELTFWQLSEDLQTVGYNIVTGAADGDPNPQMTIGSGPTESGNNTSTFKAFIKFDAIDGSASLGSIKVKGTTLFYNTASMAQELSVGRNATIAGTLGVTGQTNLSGYLNATGSAGVTGSFEVNGPSEFTGNALFNNAGLGTFIVENPATFNSTVAINGLATLGGFEVNGLAVFNGNASFNKLVQISTATVLKNLTLHPDAVLRSSTSTTGATTYINVASGFRFPDGTTQDTGISAAMRVVAGRGISTATNIDGATVINLNTATSSEIGGLRVSSTSSEANPLYVSNGALGIEQTQPETGLSTGQFGVIKIGRGLGYVRNGKEVDVVSASTSSIGGIMVGDFLSINTVTYLLSVNTATLGPALNEFSYILPVASTSTLGGIKIGNGVEINTSTGVFSVSGATTSTLGGVVIGEYLEINTTTDVLTVSTSTLGPVLANFFTYTLNTATDTVLGGIKVGDYLTINSSTGVLSVNTATLAPALIDITLPIATNVHLGGVRIPTTSTITINTTTGDISVPFATKGVPVNVGTPGVVRVGANLVIDGNGVIDVLEAGASSLGVVTPGFGMTVAAGALSVNTATTARPGIIQVGTTLSIDANAVLNLNSANVYGDISLAGDMETNGYAIRLNDGYPDTKLLLSSGPERVSLQATALNKLSLGYDTATLQATTQSYVTVTATSVIITTPNTSTAQVLIQTPELIVGSDIYNSQIQAGAYYDFSGTGAAFFPANVKFSDDTIQRTAWRGYDQGLI